MTQIKVDIDFIPLQRTLRAAAENQFPFAISRALNWTAGGARQSLQADLPSIFTLRRNWIVKGIQFRKSTKRDLTARVGSVDEFMVVHATGGRRTGSLASVPGRAVRPTFPTLVRRAKWPARMLAKGGRRKAFLLNARNGKVLVRRKRVKGSELETLWRFPGSVKYDKKFKFDELVGKYVSQHWPRNMTRSLDDALKTAF